jgi:hypothetical protein
LELSPSGLATNSFPGTASSEPTSPFRRPPEARAKLGLRRVLVALPQKLRGFIDGAEFANTAASGYGCSEGKIRKRKDRCSG